MTVVYVDTGGFIALLRRRDRAHAAVAGVYRDLVGAGARLVTADPVIGETCTRLRYDAGLPATRRFHDLVEQASLVGSLQIVESSATLRREAFELIDRFDGLSLSYADAVGGVVARQQEADAVLGLDADFRVLGFRLLPET